MSLQRNGHKLPELMAQNKIAFTFVGGSLGPEATELNQSIKVGTMPVPAIHEGDKQSWIGGERFTVAAWKESKHLKEAKQFIDFLAKPENAKKIAEGTSSETALKQVKAKNYYSTFYEQYEHIKIEPYFDRSKHPERYVGCHGNNWSRIISRLYHTRTIIKENGRGI